MKMDSKPPPCHENSSKYEESSALTSDPHFVKLPEPLIRGLSRYVVTQTDGAERNEAEVEGLQEVPVLLQCWEDGGGDEEEARDGQSGEQSGVYDSHQWLGQAPAPVDVHDWPPRAEHHDPLHYSSEEEEGKGDANHWVDNAEGLPAIGQWCCVTISCRKTNRTENEYVYTCASGLEFSLFLAYWN